MMNNEEKRKSYEVVIRKITTSWQETTSIIARMSMVAAYLVQRAPHVLWAGFFMLVDGELTVGPYNCLPARVVLPKNMGVCWSCVNSGKPVVVSNTHEFEGHVKREGPSNSEICVPIKNKKGEVLGVLHHDSADFNAFDEIDVEYLSRIAEMIEETIANLDS